LITDAARNPGLLKLELFCKGMQIHESCRITEDGGRAIMRTRAGLGSGLELILPEGLHANVPVAESFAQKSPYVLKRQNGSYVIHHEDRPVAPVTLAPTPAWYNMRTTSGKLMSKIGTLQGTYLAVYPARVCDYWLAKPHRVNCKFCSVGLNLGVDDASEKTVQEIVEVAKAAKKESGITYVDFNTGHYAGDVYLDILEPIIAAVKKETGLLIGVQTPPHHDLSRYHGLRKLGVNRVSFCFEIFDEEIFKKICPGKHAQYGLRRYPARKLDRRDRLDDREGRHTHCLRVSPAQGDGPPGRAAPENRGHDPRLQANVRGVHGTRSPDRCGPQRQGEPRSLARRGPLFPRRSRKIPSRADEARRHEDGVLHRVLRRAQEVAEGGPTGARPRATQANGSPGSRTAFTPRPP